MVATSLLCEVIKGCSIASLGYHSPRPSVEEGTGLVKNEAITKFSQSMPNPPEEKRPDLPILITNTITDGDVRKLSHDCFRSSVHKVQSPAIIGLFKRIFGTQSGAVR